MRQYQLLDHLWNVQLREKRHRHYWNIKEAHDFWRKKGPKSWGNRAYAWTETWISDALERTAADLAKMSKMARFARARNAKAKRQLERALREKKKTQAQKKASKEITIFEDVQSPTDDSSSESPPPHRILRRRRLFRGPLRQCNLTTKMPDPHSYDSEPLVSDDSQFGEELPRDASFKKQSPSRPRRSSSPSDVPTPVRDRRFLIQRRRRRALSNSSEEENKGEPTKSPLKTKNT